MTVVIVDRMPVVVPATRGPVTPAPNDLAQDLFKRALDFAEQFYVGVDLDRLGLAIYEHPAYACQVGYLYGLVQGGSNIADLRALLEGPDDDCRDK